MFRLGMLQAGEVKPCPQRDLQVHWEDEVALYDDRFAANANFDGQSYFQWQE